MSRGSVKPENWLSAVTNKIEEAEKLVSEKEFWFAVSAQLWMKDLNLG